MSSNKSPTSEPYPEDEIPLREGQVTHSPHTLVLSKNMRPPPLADEPLPVDYLAVPHQTMGHPHTTSQPQARNAQRHVRQALLSPTAIRPEGAASSKHLKKVPVKETPAVVRRPRRSERADGDGSDDDTASSSSASSVLTPLASVGSYPLQPAMDESVSDRPSIRPPSFCLSSGRNSVRDVEFTATAKRKSAKIQQLFVTDANQLWYNLEHHKRKRVSRFGLEEDHIGRYSAGEVFALEHQHMLLAISLVSCFAELAMLIVYGIAQSELNEGDDVKFTEHDQTYAIFIWKTVLSVYFLAQWVLETAATRQFFTSFTFLTIITAFYQIAVACASIAEDNIYGTYVPNFLRVWSLRIWILRATRIMLDLSPAGIDARATIVREFLRQVTFMLALVTSCAGAYRIIEIFQGTTNPLSTTFYLTLVTFSTVGYGDVGLPTTKFGMLGVMMVIFIAMAFLPDFLSQLSLLAEVLRKQSRYSRQSKHIVVAGNPTFKEIKTILSEITQLSRTRSVVFLSNSPFSERIRRLQLEPEYRERVMFIEGSPSKKKDLHRCAIERAEAIFLLSDKHAKYNRGDLHIMRDSLYVGHYQPTLPQFLWLKSDRHNFLLKNVFASVHRQRWTKMMGAVALTYPHVIPIIVNLVRVTKTAEVPVDLFTDPSLGDSWGDLYQYSRMQLVREMTVKGTLKGMHFHNAALKLQKFYGMMPLGVCRDGKVTINPPADFKLREKDKLIVVGTKSKKPVVEEDKASSPSLPAVTITGANIDPASGFPPHARRERRGSIRYVNDQQDDFDNMSVFFPSMVFPPPTQTAEDTSVREASARGEDGWCSPIEPIGTDLKPIFAENALVPLELNRIKFAVDTAKKSAPPAARPESPAKKDPDSKNGDEPEKELTEIYCEEELGLIPKPKPRRVLFIQESTSIEEERRSHEENADFNRRRNDHISIQIAIHRYTPPPIVAPVFDDSHHDDLSGHYASPVRLDATQPTLPIIDFRDNPDTYGVPDCQCVTADSYDLLSRRIPTMEYLRTWTGVGGGRPSRHFHFSGLRSEGLNVSEAHRSSSIHISCATEGDRRYHDTPLLAINTRIHAFCVDVDHEKDPPRMVVEVFTFTSCNKMLPRHKSPAWLKAGEDDFQSSMPFMTGTVFSNDMLIPLLFQTFHSPNLIRFFNRLLSINPELSKTELIKVYQRQQEALRAKYFGPKRWTKIKSSFCEGFVPPPAGDGGFGFAVPELDTTASQLVVRFGSLENALAGFTTYREATKYLLLKVRVIPLAVIRMMPPGSTSSSQSSYPITNPEPSFLLRSTDVIYFVR